MGGFTIKNATETIVATFLGILSVRIWWPISQFLWALDWPHTMVKLSAQIGAMIFVVAVLFVLPFKAFTNYSRDEKEDE